MKINVGIDLGTTYSAVATFSKELGRVQILKNCDNKECTPSVVWLDNDRTFIGEEAKNEQKNGNTNTVAFYKSMMGDEQYSAFINCEEYSAEDLSAKYLTELIKDIKATNNVDIDGAVITVPAYFNDKQREATIRAGQRAGLKVLKIINEPTAAIIAYGLTSGKEKNVMVYDLGGGTFDITIAHVNGTAIDVLATNGNHQLGGKDWDEAILNYVKDEFYSEYGVNIDDYPEDLKELQVKCEEAKKRLTQVSSTTISIQCEGLLGKYEVTREYFDDATSSLLDATLMLIKSSFEEIAEETGSPFGWDNIDEVVLVGGSTRMPQVKEMIIREYGKAPITKDINVDTIVATGAAMQAELCVNSKITLSLGKAPTGGRNVGPMGGTSNTSAPMGMTLTISNSDIHDITSHSLGMLALASDGKSYINSIIIKKNSKVNTTFSRQYNFSSDKLEVYVMQGESRDPYECDILGKYLITGFPKDNKQQLSVNFLYNSNGVVEANANLADGMKLTAIKEKVTETIDQLIARLERERQEAEEAARRARAIQLIIAIDSSGSMEGNRLAEAKKAARNFVNEFDLACTKISVLSFGNNSTFKCKGENRTHAIYKAIDSITCGEVGYGTASPLNNYTTFTGDGPRILVVLTDGYWSDPSPAIATADQAKRGGVLIYGIGIGEADEEFLRKISSGSSKKVDLSQLNTAFKEVAISIATEVASGNTLR